jgi:Transposase
VIVIRHTGIPLPEGRAQGAVEGLHTGLQLMRSLLICTDDVDASTPATATVLLVACCLMEKQGVSAIAHYDDSLNLAKNIVQVHGIDTEGNVLVRRSLRRSDVINFFGKLPPCIVGIEACATAHHWAREIGSFGNTVRRMPPAYVKPYVKRNKNDMADAEAICEAVMRPNMRFVAVKTAAQQSVLMLHRCRALLVRQRTMLANAIRAHLAELGIAIPKGIRTLLAALSAPQSKRNDVSNLARRALEPMALSLVELGKCGNVRNSDPRRENTQVSDSDTLSGVFEESQQTSSGTLWLAPVFAV